MTTEVPTESEMAEEKYYPAFLFDAGKHEIVDLRAILDVWMERGYDTISIEQHGETGIAIGVCDNKGETDD